MKRTGPGAVLVALLALSAGFAAAGHAQDVPRGFPVDRVFEVRTIGGSDARIFGITIVVKRMAQGEALRGSGSAGCNDWTGAVVLHDDKIEVGRIASTRKFCGEQRMEAEQAFLAALQSARRWRWDDGRLVLEGDGARLLLMPAESSNATDRRSDK
jgi:hypothetical protein